MTSKDEPRQPHDAWHVVQQRSSRISPTREPHAAATNVDSALEREADAMGAKAMSLAAQIHVGNAGLVLAAPFVPRLFSMLGVVADGHFTSPAAADHGAHLLQLVAASSKDSIDADEHPLTALICGLPVGHRIARSVEASTDELATIENCLHAIIAQWTILSQTSVAGLRETFLRRRGTLTRSLDAWRLTVEQKTFDVLLDRIPWSYQTVKLPWMPEPIHVEWR